MSEECAACGLEWKNRKPTSYPNLGSKSIPFVSNFRLIESIKGEHVNLQFCNLHGNGLGEVTRYINGKLEIKNTATNRWKKAKKLEVTI